jgi:hypothetical protein
MLAFFVTQAAWRYSCRERLELKLFSRSNPSHPTHQVKLNKVGYIHIPGYVLQLAPQLAQIGYWGRC